MLLPVFGKGIGIFRTDNHNFGILCQILIVILAQLRHMPAAEWSEKAPIENQ